MLRILNKNKEPVQGLDRYKQLRITKRLQFDDKTLEFNALIGDIANLENEGYIETETDRFVVKEIRPSSDGTADVLAQLDVETLEGKTFVRFETVEKTLSEAMALAFAGTGWTVGECNITKLRTLRKENCTSLDMLKQALSVYRCECKINSKQMTVSFYEEIGEDRGVYFMSDLNLRSLTVTKSSYDFYTEIEPYGANGMTIEDVNDGSKILTNYTYSNKSKRIIWKDERYTVPESLKEDAQAKLNDYSKPYVSYMADVVDLASMSDYYSILQYDIGDTITLADNATGTREKQRIVEMVVYPEEPELNSCVFANTTLTFEELAAKFSETADTVDNITLDNGTIDGSKINSFDAQKLSNFDNVLAASGVFGTLVANHAAFEEATVSRFQTNEANITTLQANYADVAIARIGVLETNYGSIRTLLAGNTAVEEAQMINLTANNAKIDEAFLRSVIAASITANDLKAGTIYTNKHTVQSEDGAMVMDGSLLTFKDANGTIRIQIGKDGQGNYNYYLVNADGDIIWDAAGITKDGVPDGLIVDDMVADSTSTYSGISASKLNINSMVGALNSEGGLSSSSIVMDENNQSLTVAFSNMKEGFESLAKGGRNLMLNTLVPDTAESNRIRINGQTDSTRSSGRLTVATHGLCGTVSSAICPYIRFGSDSVSSGTMNGLEAGETYTISFDGEWKLYSGDTYDVTRYFQVTLYGAKDGGSTFVDSIADKNKKRIPITASEKGQPMSCRYEWTFTVPDNVVKAYLIIRPNTTTSSFFAVGDYIKIENVKLEKGSVATPWSPAPEDYLTETAKLNDLIDGIQDQIDGVIDTYYYDYEPTLTNVPASDWTATDYPSHKGDMFLDTSTGKSYQFLQDEQTQTWSWAEIPDTASAQALVAAQNALDVADHKRRVFVDTPSAPYDVGDLWFTGAGGDILTCTTAKTANQQYDQADWSKLHKYTDDTYASNKYAELTSTIDGVTSRVGTLETTTTNQGKTIASHTSTLEQTATKLSAIITDSQIAELESGTNMYDKLTVVKATADGVVSDVTSLKTWKDNATGQITNLESQQNTMSQTLEGTTSEVSSIKTDLQNNYSTTTAVQTLIDQKANAITLSVSNTYATKTDAVNAVSVEYAKGTSATTAPESGWSTASPTWEQGKYIWQRTAITKNGQTTYSNVSCIQGAKGQDGQNGQNGQDGTSVAIIGTEIRYQAHTSGTSVPTGTWKEEVPTVAQGAYLWTRTKVSYSDGTSTTSYSVGRMGSNGTNGSNGSDGADGKDGKDGVSPTVTSTVTKYQQSNSGTTTPTGTWQTTPPTATAGQYMWTQTTVTYSDGATAVSYGVSRNGTNGKGISSITEYYVCTNSTSAPADSAFSTGVKTPTAAAPYLWNYEKVTYTDNSTKNLDKHIVAMYGAVGADGADGRSITGITEYYAVNNSTTAPADSDFGTAVKTVTASNKYLWNYEVVSYSTGNPTTTAKRIIGTYGDKGDKGDKGEDGSAGLNQATLYLYQRATSAPTKPSATITYTFASKAFSGINNGWSTAIPSGTNPCWVTVAVASANTASDTIASSEWTDPVKMVENGADGKDGKDGTDGTNGTNGIDGYNQATINLYKRSASTPAKPSTAVTYTFASGALSANPNGWTKTIPATDGNPCWVVSAAAISKDATASLTSASWSSPVKMVEDGTDGEKGDTGVGISKVTPQYCWHTNETTAPTTGWSSEKTTAPTGKPYLWIRSMVEYDDGTSEPTTALCDKTLNDLQTRMTAAEQKITDDAIISTVSTRYGIGDANLIYNSTGYGGSTDGWELSPVKDGYALSSTQDSTRPGKTDYALSVKAASTSTDYVYMRQTQAHWITVEQGKKYTISGFYFRGSKVRAQCYVGVEYSTNNGKSWSTSSYGTYGVSMTASATWTSFSKTFTAPSNLIRVGVVMAGSTSASSSYMVQVSDLVLVRGETAMPWAESPTSLIEQTSDMIRLKAEKLVWTANNSSLTEEGELTVTKGLIGGFTIDDTAIFTKTKDSTSSGAILISTSDVSRTVAGKSRQSVRLAVGQNFGVLTDGTLIARNVDLSGTIAATAGSIGGIKIGTDGFYTEVNSGTEDGRQYKRYFSISKRGEFIQYRDVTPESYDPTEERYWEVDNPYRTGYLYISKTGEIKSQNYSNGYWRTDGRILRGREERDGPNGEIAHNYDAYEEWARDPDYAIRFYAPTRSSDETSFAISIEDVEDDHLYDKLIPDDYVYHQYPFLVRYGGSVQCTALTVMDISSGTGSTVVANSSGKLFRSSSSKRYKDYIADMTEDEAEKLYDLPVVQFKYKDGYLDREDEMYDKPMHGFFAEDVADLFEDGGIHNNFGDVENYSERAIIARLVKLVQMQHEEIESLKASMQ